MRFERVNSISIVPWPALFLLNTFQCFCFRIAGKIFQWFSRPVFLQIVSLPLDPNQLLFQHQSFSDFATTLDTLFSEHGVYRPDVSDFSLLTFLRFRFSWGHF